MEGRRGRVFRIRNPVLLPFPALEKEASVKVLKNVVLALLVLFALVAAGGFLIPSGYRVERSVTIQAPAEVVFDQVNDLRKNEAWSPWKDTTMKITYGPNTVGEGATSSWESENMGRGSQTIEESVPNDSIAVFLDFKEMGTAEAHWSFRSGGDGVTVTQAMTGEAGMNPIRRYMNLMMDKMIGPYFEKGLAGLKEISEAEAARIKSDEAARAAAPADSASTVPGAAAPAP
jgi:hypothetical protein